MEIRGDDAGARPLAERRRHASATAAACTCRTDSRARSCARTRAARSSRSTRATRRAACRSAVTHTVFAPAYGPPFVTDLERGRRYGTLADFHNFVKLAYLAPVAAPLRRHGLRAGRRAGQQAAPRHGVRAHALLGQAVHGLGDQRGARRATRSRCAGCCSARTFVAEHCVILGNVNVNSPLVLDGEASRVIRTYAAANQAPVCVPFILGGAMGPVTTAGALAQCFAEAIFCVALGAARAARLAGDPRQLPVLDVAAQRRADLRHARAGARVSGDRPARAPARRAAALRRQSVRLQGAGRAGGLRERQLAVARVPRRRELRAARGRLARGGTRDVL